METIMTHKSKVQNVISWIFGILVFAAGVLNTFWGNDPGFGIFLLLLSFVYFPMGDIIFRKITKISIPGIAKIVLGLLIIWVVLGVGELFGKIEIMTSK
jgi:hypothetical protein